MIILKDLIKELDLEILSEGSDLNRTVATGCCCDLLSWVMANGRKDAIWVTVQAHVNVIAVASLLELAGVIITSGLPVEEKTIERARSEGVTLLSSRIDAFQLAGKLYNMCIGKES